MSYFRSMMLLLAFLWVAEPALASNDKAVVCNSCSFQAMRQAAIANHQPSAGQENIHVLSLTTQQHQSFLVFTMSEPGFHAVVASPTQPSASMSTAINAVFSVRSTLDELRIYGITIGTLTGGGSSNAPATALELVGNTGGQGLVEQLLSGYISSGAAGISGHHRALVNQILAGEIASTIITVEFPDGSKAKFRLTGTHLDMHLNIVVDVSIETNHIYDPSGNRVTTNFHGFTGMITGSQNVVNWFHMLSRLGVQMIIIEGAGGGGRMTCTREADGTERCVLIPS